MQILFESILIAVLGLPLGMPWLALPYALLRSLVGRAEDAAAADIAASTPGDTGTLARALIGVGAVGVLAVLVLYGLMAWGLGGAM